ncbi:MAG: DUF3592 domain-containing protein [Rikenellaceae bacterium]|nr:DUF3592 domain-containing protein [Rikenellaceae bacterium]
MSKFKEFMDNKGFVFLLVGALALGTLGYGVYNLCSLWQKQKEYDATTATVVKVAKKEHVRRTGRKTRRSVEHIYTITYKTAKGFVCVTDLQGSSLSFVSYKKGDTLEVLYNPQNYYDVTNVKGTSRLGWFLIGLGAVVLVAIPPIYKIEKRRSERKAQEGEEDDE